MICDYKNKDNQINKIHKKKILINGLGERKISHFKC